MENIRFLHCADLHVGASRRDIPDYLERQLRMLRQLYSAAKKKKCDFIILGGDIYNDKGIPYAEKEAVLKILVENRDILTIIISGQHDLISHDYSHLSIIDTMGKAGVLNVQVANMVPQLLHYKDWRIIAIPYDKNITTGKAQTLVADYLEKVPDKNKVIGTFHGMVNGSRNDLGYSFPGGIVLPIDEIRYWALGDIHKAQKINKISYYSGSPIQHNFGEVEQKRGALLVDITPDNLKITKINLHGFTPLVVVNLSEGEAIPENCYVSVASEDKDLYIDLPANVVKKKTIHKQIAYTYNRDTIEESDILQIELEKLQYTPEVIQDAVDGFKKYMKTL